MTALGTTRPGRSAAFGALILAVWFGLGLQPCAMAAGPDHDCPHCPPAHTDDGHALHQASPHRDDGHRAHSGHVDRSNSPCDATQADCCDSGPVNIDSRSVDFKVKGDKLPALAVAPWISLPAAVYSPEHDRVADPPRPPPGSVPLHKLHCVYLD